MIRKPNYILMDDHGKEFQEKSMHSINLTVNDGDIHQFVAGHIPSHWHKRLEIFLLLEGKVSVSTGDNTCKLHAGDGCFINTEVLHSFTADTASPCLYRSFVFSADIVGGAPGSIFDTTYVRPLLENGASFLKFQKENGDTIYFEQFQRAFTACVSEEYGYEFSVRNALSNIMLYIASKSATVTKRSIPSVQEARLKKCFYGLTAILMRTSVFLTLQAPQVSVPGSASVFSSSICTTAPLNTCGEREFLTRQSCYPIPTGR